jgi:hypothetical protein
MSTTTISLPRPFILVKAWLASVLMGGLSYMGKAAALASHGEGAHKSGDL